LTYRAVTAVTVPANSYRRSYRRPAVAATGKEKTDSPKFPSSQKLFAIDIFLLLNPIEKKPAASVRASINCRPAFIAAHSHKLPTPSFVTTRELVFDFFSNFDHSYYSKNWASTIYFVCYIF
jgi:hypothetical protein